MATQFKAGKCPDDSLALSNCLVVHPDDFGPSVQYVTLFNPVAKASFTFKILRDKRVTPKTVGATGQHRRWALLSLGQDVTVTEFIPDKQTILFKMTIEIDTLAKGKVVEERLNTEELTKHFMNQYGGHVFTVEELLAFEFHAVNFAAKIVDIALADPTAIAKGDVSAAPTKMAKDGSFAKGVLNSATQILFQKATDAKIKLEGQRAVNMAPVVSPDFKFEDMGIGGLDAEFKTIFRRAFASRIFPPHLMQELGIMHVKGMLLYGPPGTGKTLIARQIGKLLKAREPKIVNGPEILNKYVGQAEENIRKLFADAEAEYKAKGDESALHLIIFDEIDAICKQRGSRNDGTGVGDSVVNQLLSKLDGVEQINNILVIGMTNRKDLLDDALLRPGRLEIHVEIGLPDEFGRAQILKIHTAEMRKHKRLADDVNVEELATLTKNFSGAEIQGLVKSAASFALNRHTTADTIARPKQDTDKLVVTRSDFLNALAEITPAFGYSDDEFKGYAPNGIISYNPVVEQILAEGEVSVRQAQRSARTPLVTLLLHGMAGTGKTAIACTIAKKSGFPFIKFITPETLVGYSEAQKCSMITKTFDDAYKSLFSVVIVDGIERLMEYVPIGPRFSNMVLQTLMVYLNRDPPQGKRLLIIATTSQRDVLDTMGLSITGTNIFVPLIQDVDSIVNVIRTVELFTSAEEPEVIQRLRSEHSQHKFAIGIKRLLNIVEKARQDDRRKLDLLIDGLRSNSLLS